MGKKKPGTPRSRIRSVLRKSWMMFSRERRAALVRSGYRCEAPGCGVKQSKAKGREVKIEVHHLNGIWWTGILDLIFKWLFCPSDELICLCVSCHDALHSNSEDGENHSDDRIEIIKELKEKKV